MEIFLICIRGGGGKGMEAPFLIGFRWIPDWAQVRFVDNHKQHPDNGGGGIEPQPEGPESLSGPTGLSSTTLTETPASPGVDVCPGPRYPERVTGTTATQSLKLHSPYGHPVPIATQSP
ncbi:unnamed protein product [Boreogadus saida]